MVRHRLFLNLQMSPENIRVNAPRLVEVEIHAGCRANHADNNPPTPATFTSFTNMVKIKKNGEEFHISVKLSSNPSRIILGLLCGDSRKINF